MNSLNYYHYMLTDEAMIYTIKLVRYVFVSIEVAYVDYLQIVNVFGLR